MKKTVFDIMKENDSERKMADFLVKQKQPYWFKKRYAEIRAREFVQMCNAHGKNYHVSVGGLDSITLLVFLRSIGIDCPAISVSSLEDKSIQKIHKELGVISLKPAKRKDGTYYTKQNILQEFGFPVISKEKAKQINILKNPTDKNIISQKKYLYGIRDNGSYSQFKLPEKWIKLFVDENPNFKVSDKCCRYLKEKPCEDWEKSNNSVPFLGLMASEGGRREMALKIHGCNYWGSKKIRSCPFAIFTKQDLLQLSIELGVPVPEIYGEIKRDCNGTLYTTGEQRTGCSICGFGIQLEKRPHRFDRMHERNIQEWDFWMKHCCIDNTTGERYGWGRVLSYIGVPWEFDDKGNMIDLDGQIHLF